MITTLKFFDEPDITMAQLESWAGQDRTARGIPYQSTLVKRVVKTDRDGDSVVIMAFVTRVSGHQYQTLIEAVADPDPDKPLKIKVFCSCPDFKYRAAYGLEQRGALYRSTATDAKLGIAITTPPEVVTPAPTVCKHCLSAIYNLGKHPEYLRSDYHGT